MTEVNLQNIEMDFGFKTILKGVSFYLNSGEKTALVGANGSGKTTLLRIIIGLVKPEKGTCFIRRGAAIGYLNQETDIGGEDIFATDYIKKAQEPVFLIEAKLRETECRMAEPMDDARLEKLMAEYGKLQSEFQLIGGYETDEKFGKICTALKIGGEILEKKCAELSGGQKTIVKLARVLLEEPDVLLLDEPTNHLDIEALEWLEAYIKNYRGAVLIVSHDRYFIDKTVNKTVLLYNGTVDVYHGNYSFCLQEQERLMLVEFEQYKSQQKQIEAMKAAIKRFKEWGERNPSDKRHHIKARNMERRIERMELIDKPQLDPRKLPMNFSMGQRSGKRVLAVEDMSFGYGAVPLFCGAEMEVIFKERVCLLGANGVGKTSLVRLLLGETEPDGGKIALAESARVGYIEQNVAFKDESASILTAFCDDAKVHENEARRILARYFITRDEVHKRLQSLSGGERVIVRLAMLMQRQVNLLILDEPTNHLDIDTKEILEESLSDFPGTLFFISHDRFFINRLATRVVTIRDRAFVSIDGNFDDYVKASL